MEARKQMRGPALKEFRNDGNEMQNERNANRNKSRKQRNQPIKKGKKRQRQEKKRKMIKNRGRIPWDISSQGRQWTKVFSITVNVLDETQNEAVL